MVPFCHSLVLMLSLGKKKPKKLLIWISMSLLFLSDLQTQSDCSAINYCRILVGHRHGKIFQLLQKVEWVC